MEAIKFFAENAVAFSALVFVFGLIVGSFLNVVILRFPLMLESSWREQCAELFEECKAEQSDKISLSFPSSRCPSCGHIIRVWENIPVISYLLLRGKCSSCQSAISVRYPSIELGTAIISLVVSVYYGFTWECLFVLLFSWSLIALTFIDMDHYLLPDDIVYPLLWSGLLLNTQGFFVPLYDAVIGATAGYLSLWFIFHLFKLLTGKEGMGYGDFKLLAALGAWAGWQALLPIILISSIVGSVLGIIMIMAGRDKAKPIPFGPYLAIAGWVFMVWKDQILALYQNIFAI